MIHVRIGLRSKKMFKTTSVIAVVLLGACLILLSACVRTGVEPENLSNNKQKNAIETSLAITSEPSTKTSEPLDNSTEGMESFQDITRISEKTMPYKYFINTVDNEYILPNITTDPIVSWEALEAMSEYQLQLLRNEIYARHGYVFKSKALNDYFSEKSWYKPDPSIREIKLSETEQANIDLIKNYENRNPFTLIGGTIISWDLDMDGVKELIQLDAPSYDEYTLHVNHEFITAIGDNLMGYCSVIDLDKSDSQCEILVRSMGPSNDDSFQLYRYQNGHIEKIGQVDGLLRELSGNGYCSIWIRASILHTWFLLDLYRINQDGILVDVEQDVFPVSATIKMVDGKAFLEEIPYIFPDIKEDADNAFYPYEYNAITIVKDLPVVCAPEDSQSAGILKQGERITFLGSDNKQWVKIQGENGIIGWFKLNKYKILGLDGNEYSANEFFSYLCNAD